MEDVLQWICSLWEPGMPEKAYVVHHMNGRLRIRVPAKRKDQHFFHQVHNHLTGIQNVKHVHVNPVTGSVLVHYTGTISELFMQAAASGLAELADLEMGLPPVQPVQDRLKKQLMRIDGAIVRSTQGTVNGGAVVLMSLLIGGTVQLLRGQGLGPAVPLLWYAAQAISGMLPDQTTRS